MNKAPAQTYPCRVCGRKFVSETLPRHEAICAKQAKKKRKVFNSMKQRIAESGISLQQAERSLKRPEPKQRPRGGGWRREHEEFIAAIRAAKMMSIAEKSGRPLPASFYKQQVPSAPREDLVPCPHCGRRFNEVAAQRHIAFCKQQRQRLDARPQAQPQARPPPKTSTNGTGYAAAFAAAKAEANAPPKGRSNPPVANPNANLARTAQPARAAPPQSPAKTAVRPAAVAAQPAAYRQMSPQKNPGKFCQQCGTSFPSAQVKFCVTCGARRLAV